jgi:hypothetical protein
MAVADACEDGCMELMVESNCLLAACDCLVESKEEILELNDLSAQTYVSAHEKCGRNTFVISPEFHFIVLLILELVNTSLHK